MPVAIKMSTLPMTSNSIRESNSNEPTPFYEALAKAFKKRKIKLDTVCPPSDPVARRILEEMNAEITNIDVTIIAQQPKLSPHRDAMVASIAQLLDLPEGHVNVKATTTDHLGFIGRSEGLCAMAILAIEVGA